MFQKNIDSNGRLIRFAIASVLLILALWFHSWVLLAFSIFTFIEAAFSWCVFYQIMGWNSCPIGEKHDDDKNS